MPYEFPTLSELQSAVSQVSVSQSIQNFAAKRAASLRELVQASVSGNTFRAFRFKSYGVEKAPSAIFRTWTETCLEGTCRSLVNLPSFDAMTDNICAMATDLDNYWHESTGGVDQVRIGFGRAAKLLCLSVKHLLWHPEFSVDDRRRFLPLLNVPLDSYTLQGIRRVASELGITGNASMRFVRDAGEYRRIQNCIRSQMPEGCHPIHYEFAAWNMAHPSVR